MILATGFEEMIQSYPEIIEGAQRVFHLSKWINNAQRMVQQRVMTRDGLLSINVRIRIKEEGAMC